MRRSVGPSVHHAFVENKGNKYLLATPLSNHTHSPWEQTRDERAWKVHQRFLIIELILIYSQNTQGEINIQAEPGEAEKAATEPGEAEKATGNATDMSQK